MNKKIFSLILIGQLFVTSTTFSNNSDSNIQSIRKAIRVSFNTVRDMKKLEYQELNLTEVGVDAIAAGGITSACFVRSLLFRNTFYGSKIRVMDAFITRVGVFGFLLFAGINHLVHHMIKYDKKQYIKEIDELSKSVDALFDEEDTDKQLEALAALKHSTKILLRKEIIDLNTFNVLYNLLQAYEKELRKTALHFES